MPLLDCAIITPWVAAADDPSDQPANHPKLVTDYPHVIDAAPQLMDEFSTPDVLVAVARAESEGEGFRSALHAMAAAGATGYGLRVPQAIWEALREAAQEDRVAVVAKYPYLMGPVDDPAETDWELYRMVLSVTTEGVRLFEDRTGQPASNIVPAPNQYTVRAIMDETVLSAVDANPLYWYLTGVTIPDDPLNPEGTPASPLEKPPGAEMTQAEQDAYRAWQESQGVPTAFLAAMRDQAKAISAEETTNPTFGQVTIETAAWQSTLDQDPSSAYELPSLEILARLIYRSLRTYVNMDLLSDQLKALIEMLKEEDKRRQLAQMRPR